MNIRSIYWKITRCVFFAGEGKNCGDTGDTGDNSVFMRVFGVFSPGTERGHTGDKEDL